MGNIQILALDDDPIIRKMLEITLEPGGYQVTLSASGSDAIAALQSKKFDIIITDLKMGDPDGFAVLESAKDLNPLTKGIVITGNQDVSSAIKAINIGVEGYFLKPFSPRELLECVQKTVNKLKCNKKVKVKYVETFKAEDQIYTMIQLMSHDIRSALILMSASVRFLTKRVNEEMVGGVSDELDKLSSRCTKLTTMAEEYLSQIFFLKNNTVDLEGQELNLLDDIITPVLDELSVDIVEKNIVVDNYIDSSINETDIFGDRVELKAVFRNLFKNAIKYGGKGCTIGFDLKKQSNHYQLAVFNTGLAIPEYLQNKLFMNKGRKRINNKDGAGIGLYLTKNIIQKHGGDIWYDKIDAAPHFVFTLPKDITMRPPKPR